MTNIELAQIVTAIATSITAIAALALAIYEGIQNRKHNRLSLKPVLVLDITKDRSPTTLSASIVNTGLGPAKIKKMRLFVSGKEVKDNLEENFQIAIEERLVKLNAQKVSTSELSSGYVIRASQECPVAYVKLQEREPCTVKQLEERLDDIDFVIEYESFYGEADVYDTRQR